jgi:hypothetical protein
MAGIYRPTIIRYYDSQGRQVPKGTPGARRVREKSKTFWGRVPAVTGKPRSIALCDDADAAEEMLAAMKQRAKRIARGDIDPFEEHRARPLGEHLEDFQLFLESKANTAAHVDLTLQRITSAFDGCRFEKLADLNAGRVVNWLAEQRKPKTNPEFALVPHIKEWRNSGATLKTIADKLNNARHTMRDGRSWTQAGVRRILKASNVGD